MQHFCNLMKDTFRIELCHQQQQHLDLEALKIRAGNAVMWILTACIMSES